MDRQKWAEIGFLNIKLNALTGVVGGASEQSFINRVPDVGFGILKK